MKLHWQLLSHGTFYYLTFSFNFDCAHLLEKIEEKKTELTGLNPPFAVEQSLK